MAYRANRQLREEIWDHRYNSSPSSMPAEDEKIVSFARQPAKNSSPSALSLVQQAAELFEGMENQARETEARAQSLCKSAAQRLLLAEKQRDAAERARHDVVNEFNGKLEDVTEALHRAQKRVVAAEDHAGRNQSGRILAREQYLAPRRREKPEVQRPVAHLAAEEIHEDAQTAEEDREPQVEVLEDPREHRAVLFEVEQTANVSALHFAVDEQEPGGPPPIEVDDVAILGALLGEPGARRRSDRGEGLSFVTQLDIELASVRLLVFSSRTGVSHDEARHRTSRSQIHLQEQRPVSSAPAVGLTSRHTAVRSLLRPLIRVARHTARDGTVKCEVHPAIRPVDLELINPGDWLSTVGRPDDIQADEAGVDRRLDVTTDCTIAAVWARALEAPSGRIVSLIDLTEQANLFWDLPKTPSRGVDGVNVSFERVGSRRPRIFTANPDEPSARELEPTLVDGHDVVEVPPWRTWSLVWAR